MTAVEWPAILKPVDFGYTLINEDVSGGIALGGGEQVIASAGPRWEASMTLAITSRNHILALRALRAQLQGRVNPVRLPNFDGRQLSWPLEDLTDRTLYPSVAQELDGTRWLDGTAYGGGVIPPAAEIVATAADAPLRAMTIDITVTQGGALLAGQQFSIGDYLYEIATVDSLGDVYTVTIQPPLREPVSAMNNVVRFTDAAALMRLNNLASEFRKLEDLRFATLALEFSEYIVPPPPTPG